MAHIVVGLFENKADAGKAVSELKAAGYTRDISLIAKSEHTGKVHLLQVKQHDEEIEETEKGADWGLLGGIIGGLSAVLNPLFAAPAVVVAFAVTMGVAGAAVGAAFGEYMAYLQGAGLPPERAKLFQDKIRAGQVFVSVADTKGTDNRVRSIFETYNAEHIHTLEVEK